MKSFVLVGDVLFNISNISLHISRGDSPYFRFITVYKHPACLITILSRKSVTLECENRYFGSTIFRKKYHSPSKIAKTYNGVHKQSRTCGQIMAA